MPAVRFLLLSLLLLGAAGCGQKGPLVLPPEPPAKTGTP
jgi:predicted small lipoprotein YifL